MTQKSGYRISHKSGLTRDRILDEAEALFAFLERHWPRLVNAIESRIIPTTNNATEEIIRIFNQHYKTFCGFENIESARLYLGVFEKVERFSGAEFDSFSTASLITRSTNDIMQIQMVMVMMIRMMFFAPIIGVGGVIRAIGKSSSMWWLIALAVGILSILVLVVYRVAVPKFKIMQKLVDRLNLVSRESLSGMMVIRFSS